MSIEEIREVAATSGWHIAHGDPYGVIDTEDEALVELMRLYDAQAEKLAELEAASILLLDFIRGDSFKLCYESTSTMRFIWKARKQAIDRLRCATGRKETLR